MNIDPMPSPPHPDWCMCGRCVVTRQVPPLFGTVSGTAEIAPVGVRKFETGATRSAEVDRYDPEGFLSPLAIERFCEYMQKHRLQPDGSVRDSDNWQKGLPLSTYMKGMWRHFLHLWTRFRGHPVSDPKAAADAEEDLCALLFNVQGMLHEKVKARLAQDVKDAD